MLIALIFLLIISFQNTSQEILLQENFNNLNNWQPFKFGRGKKESIFTIDSLNGTCMLRAESRASASGLIGVWRFDPNNYPRIRWRWKVIRYIAGAHGRNKETDDYALRIFLMFRGNPEELSLWDKIRNSALHLFYGFEPPHSALIYVWSNVTAQDSSYNSPYSDQVKIVCVRNPDDIHTDWKEEEINIVSDYTRCFGNKPPSEAAIAIMCDSDNSGQSSLAFMDYITVLRW